MELVDSMAADSAWIRRAVSSFCSEIRDLRSNVIAADFYEQRAAGRLYLDCSQHVFSDMTQFAEYQETLLRDEYYTASGSIKWNLYLVIVCDEQRYDGLVESGLAGLIEEDQRYARKLVLRDTEVESELKARFDDLQAAMLSTPPDVVGEWTRNLSKLQLDGVFMPKQAMDKVVSRYIEGNPIQSRSFGQSDSKSHAMTEIKLGFIDKLIIRDYRSCLASSEWSFANANLIHGRNGSGKTSLLEAIELWICGQTLRNPKQSEAVQQLGLCFQGQRHLSWNNKLAPADYRRRALQWYGIHKARADVLHQSFGRFNFFDTDAATRLAQGTSREDVQEAFTGLVLGRDAAVILERARGIHGRFQDKHRQLERVVSNLGKERTRIRGNINSAKGDLDRSEGELLDVAKQKLKAAGWKNRLPRTVQQLGVISTDVGRLNSAIGDCLKLRVGDPGVSLYGFDERLNQIEEARSWCAMQVGEQSSMQQLLTHAAEEIADLEDKVEHMSRLAAYVEKAESAKLKGLNDAIEARTKRVQERGRAIQVASSIAAEITFERDDTLARALERTVSVSTKAQRETARTKKLLDEANHKATEVDSLVGEIRAGATQLLQLEPDRRQCPLCGQIHGSGELERRIGETAGTRWQERVQELQITLAALNRELERSIKSKEQLQNIIYSASVLLPDDNAETMGVASFLNRLPNFRAAHTRNLSTLKALEEARERLAEEGFVEDEYKALTDWMKKHYSKVSVRFENLAEFKRHRRLVSGKLAQRRRARLRAQERLANAESAASEKLSELGISDKLSSEVVGRLSLRAEWGQQVSECVKLFDSMLTREKDATLRSLASIASTAESAVTNYYVSKEQAYTSRQISKRMNRQLRNCSQKLEDTRKSIQQIELAIEVLERLLDPEKGSNAAIGSYLESCIDMLNELFGILCWPREFSEVSLRNKGLVARRSDTGEVTPITRLSSGQRSALALATFLALNKCVGDGPPYLLLDDPVAHVDDLNALAFFDVLRMFARSEKRQLFFATSDAKQASLIRRKFGFLKKDFAVHTLPRRG